MYCVPTVETAALRACTLASRNFLRRSREHLFAGIFCYTNKASRAWLKLDVLVSESPHILTSYVRYVHIVAQHDSEDVDFTLASQILGLVPKLEHLFIFSNFDASSWNWLPVLFADAFNKALGLPHFRSLSLGQYVFASVMELECLLIHAHGSHGLKELVLDMISFEDTSPGPANHRGHEPLVVLDSLYVGIDHSLYPNVVATSGVDAMLSIFSMVDITHLHALHVVKDTPLLPFLRVNSQTLQKVRCEQPLKTLSDPDILKNNTCLSHIDITDFAVDMSDTLKLFGNLHHLSALQTISLRFPFRGFGIDHDMTEHKWSQLDKVLMQARGTLEQVEIFGYIDEEGHGPPDMDLVHRLLPSVAQKISVYSTED